MVPLELPACGAAMALSEPMLEVDKKARSSFGAGELVSTVGEVGYSLEVVDYGSGKGMDKDGVEKYGQ